MPLEAFFELARSIAPEPYLIEIARSASGSREGAAFYVWSTESIAAAVAGDLVRIQRCVGESLYDENDVIDLDARELAWLADVCVDWRQRRDGWGAFWPSRSVPHPLGRPIDNYREPGKRRREHSIPHGKGRRDWTGREVLRRCAPVAVDGVDARIVGELWQEKVRVGEQKRVPVGVRYRGPTLRVDARRLEALVTRPRRKGGLLLLAEEDAFVAALKNAHGRGDERQVRGG